MSIYTYKAYAGYKKEFVNLLLEDIENMAIMHKATGKLYYIHSITNINVILVNNGNIIAS